MSLRRRAFLGGAAVVVGLPFLESLTLKPARGQAAAAPKRFLGYLYPNGYFMDDWRPVGTGSSFQLGPAMGPTGRTFSDGLAAFADSQQGPGLDQVKSSILVLTGLQNTKQAPGPGDHAGGVGSLLTNRTVPRNADAVMGGPSIDYVIAQAIGRDTRRPYLVMAGEGARPAGTLCDTGFSCAVGDHVSFDDKGQNLPRFDTPGQIFDQMFAGFDPTATAETLKKRLALDTSILDVVQGDATRLQARLSRQDRPRLEEYLTSVREVERRIANLASGGGRACTVPTRVNAFSFENGRQTIDLCHELMAIAFQCDVTRVISFMWGNSSNGRPHNFIGCPGGHHDISHHGTNAQSIAKIKRIDYWWFRRFSEFLLRLKGMTDIDGRTVLDNTIVFQSSDVSDGDRHNHDDMPVVLAGGATGFKLGQHLHYEGNWFGELFLSIAQGLGVKLDSFGEHGSTALTGLS